MESVRHHIVRSKAFWTVALAMVAFIWGFAFVVVKDSLDIIPTFRLLTYRFFIAFIGLIIVFRKRLKAMNRRAFLQGMVLGFFLFASYALQTYGCLYTTAGKNAFLTTIYVILVPFFGLCLFRSRVNRFHVLAAFLSIAGIALLTLKGESGVNIGDILTLCCGATFALHIIFIDRYTVETDPVLLTILQMGFVTIASSILSLMVDGIPVGREAFNSSLLIPILYLGLLSTLLGFLIQTVSLKYMHPVTATVILSLESVFGVLCSAVFLHEELSLRMLFGCVLMFIAILIAEVLGGDKQGNI